MLTLSFFCIHSKSWRRCRPPRSVLMGPEKPSSLLVRGSVDCSSFPCPRPTCHEPAACPLCTSLLWIQKGRMNAWKNKYNNCQLDPSNSSWINQVGHRHLNISTRATSTTTSWLKSRILANDWYYSNLLVIREKIRCTILPIVHFFPCGKPTWPLQECQKK